MKALVDSLSALRAIAEPEHLAELVLLETADKMGRRPKLLGELEGRQERLHKDPNLPHLQVAAYHLMKLPLEERLRALDWLFISTDRRGVLHPWIARVPAQQLAALAKDAASIRCSFGWSLHPALHIGVAAKIAGRTIRLTHVSDTVPLYDLAVLCKEVLEIDLVVECGDPFTRHEKQAYDFEIVLPPFGHSFGSHGLSTKTLAWFGSAPSGRLSAEALAIADILAQAPAASAVIGLSASALFRSVGVESLVRDELIASGRLAAVLSVPSGMMYTETGIITNLLVLSPEDQPPSAVRFLDLSDERLATRTSRGRYEAKNGVLWLDTLGVDADSNNFGRDVSISEIEAQDGMLTPDRYLRSDTAEKLNAFHQKYEVRPLSDIVTLVRPAALPKAEEGESVAYEASPGDVGESGFLRRPEKTSLVDRSGLRKARNQQLEPGDVVLSVKGTIGAVGLTPKDVPDRHADQFWTAGQSMMILRPRAALVAPEVLYEYLSSDLVRDHLNTLAGGTVIQSLNIKDLKKLPIPLPPKDEQMTIKQAFYRRQEAYRELNSLRRSIRLMRQANWPHDLLTSGRCAAIGIADREEEDGND